MVQLPVKRRGESARELLRGVGGGLLFGSPLLYTQEMWSHGALLPWWRILVLLGVTVCFVSVYVQVGGFRRDHTLVEKAADVTVSFGLGIVIAAVMLFVLGQVSWGDSAREVVGKIALETVPIAMGVSVARAQLGGGQGAGGGDGQDGEDSEGVGAGEPGPLGQALVAAGGAMLFAFNVAPTEEPVLLGIENEWWRIVALLGFMLPVAAGLVFFADFRGSHAGRDVVAREHPLSTPLGETVVSVVVALLVSAMLLWVFGRIDAGSGLKDAVHQVVTLGFVAVLGSSAARLLT